MSFVSALGRGTLVFSCHVGLREDEAYFTAKTLLPLLVDGAQAVAGVERDESEQ